MKKLSLISLLFIIVLSCTFVVLAEKDDFFDISAINDLPIQKLVMLRSQVDDAILRTVTDVDYSAYSLDGLLYASNGSEVRVNGYEGSNPDLVIPSEIEGIPVTMIHDGAFSDNKTLTSITLPSTISAIPDEMLYGCSNLTSLNIPDSVRSIGRWAFNGTYKLNTIILPSGLTSISSAAFQRAEGLTGIVVIPKGVTTLSGYTFSRCDKLKGIVIQSNLSLGDSDFASSSLEFIYVKDGCAVSFDGSYLCEAGLRVAILPASVTSISDTAFSECNMLTIVTPEGSYAEAYAREHWIMCNTTDYSKYIAEYDALTGD